MTGIPNWCLAGLSRYYANGNRLVQPRKVSQATTNLRTVSNTVGLYVSTDLMMDVFSFDMGSIHRYWMYKQTDIFTGTILYQEETTTI
jgi:hypothetical protein